LVGAYSRLKRSFCFTLYLGGKNGIIKLLEMYNLFGIYPEYLGLNSFTSFKEGK